jgi:LPXTG-motif cell wall-anchored protein
VTTFLRARARAAGALVAALVTGATVLAAAGTAAATDEIPADSLLVQSDRPIEPRIVGGGDASDDEYPFIGQLRVDMGGGYIACGSSLIEEDLVLTAAHCVADIGGTGPTDVVTVGFGAINQADLEFFTADYVWSGNAAGIPDDWALVRLTEAVPADVATPVDVVSDAGFDEAEEFRIIGWGDLEEGANAGSETLQEATVPLVTDADCAASYGDSFTPDAELCAGLPEGGIDSCQGDSGGPLLTQTNDDDANPEWVQVGVVSWGNGCAQPGFPGIYTQLSSYVDDINAVATGENTEPTVTDVNVTTTVGTPVEITFAGEDAEGDELSYKVGVPDPEGSAELSTNDPENLSSIVVTPAEGFEGDITFAYAANDGGVDSTPALITVTVEGEPEPSPTPTPTDTPTEDPGDDDGDDNGEGGDGDELPDTGSSTTTMIGLALLLAAGGAGVAVAARRRTAGSNL